MLGDTFTVNHFAVALGKFQVATFQSVEGLVLGADAVETKPVLQEQPGPGRAQEITLSRPMDQSEAFVDWVKASQDKGDLDGARQDVAITYFDARKEPVRRLNLTNAWAKSWTGPELDAAGTEAAIETVTIVCEDVAVE
ncbi:MULTISPECIES: phage tail protein [Streptomyces]|uniref:phage tail protein n=1 Tax=Streptomyces TaxID=1883 RepID=UPI0031D03E4D